MKHHEEDFLDNALKNLDHSVILNEKRKRQIRKNIIKAIDQEKSRNNLYFFKKIIPLSISGLLVLLVSLFLVEQSVVKNKNADNINQEKGSPSIIINQEKISAQGKNNESKFNISDQLNSKIDGIRASGFELRLPNYTPIDGTELINIVKRNSGNGVQVTARYHYQNKELFSFSQETIKQGDRLNSFIQEVKKEADVQITLNGKATYFINRQRGKEPIKIVYIITNGYVFSINSYTLTKKQLIDIATSIKTDKL